MLKIQICILLLVICNHQSWGFFSDVKQFGRDVFKLVHDRMKIGVLRDDYLADNTTINQLQSITNYTGMEVDMVKILSNHTEMTPFKEKLQDLIVDIDEEFKKLLGELQYHDKTEPNLYVFASHLYRKIRDRIARIYKILTEGLKPMEKNTGLLKFLLETQKRTSCGEAAFRRHNGLVDMIRTIFILELKIVAVQTFIVPFMARKDDELHEWTDTLMTNFGRRLKEYISIVTESLLPRTLQACDPSDSVWTRDESWIEIEKFVQKVVARKRKFFSSPRSCAVRAKRYDKGDKYVLDFYTKDCHGELIDCSDISVNSGCLTGYSANKSTRYEFIKTNDGIPFGDSTKKCGYPHLRFGGGGVGHCACSCFENGHAVNVAFINSDVNNDMVITGLRFRRRNKTLYLQAKQGKLIADGVIASNSERWIKLRTKDTDRKMMNSSNRAFFFDDVIVPHGSVLTGVRLAPVTLNGKSGFQIQIRAVKFKYSTGKLCQEPECVVEKQPENIKRIEQRYFGENSIYYPGLNHHPDATHGNFIQLYHTELERDAGQSTLPLFDRLTLEMNSSAPLGGVGMFHKVGRDSKGNFYAGFISLRLYSLDYKKYADDFIDNHLNWDLNRPDSG